MGLRPDTLHGPLDQNKVTQHLRQKNSPTQNDDCGRLGEDMTVIPTHLKTDLISFPSST